MKLYFPDLIRFCPKCGVDSLERDYLHQPKPKLGGGGEPGKRQTDGSEWLCRTCGFGFKIGKSSRWHLAEHLTSRDRKLRNGVTFGAECVGPEIAAAFERAERTKEQRNWRAHKRALLDLVMHKILGMRL